jgi:beta-mannosidase
MDRISLNGKWRVAASGAADWFPAQVPGCVHQDLLAAGRIRDPFYRDNELAVQWVGETDWVYAREFDVPRELLERERVLLRCEGLDTLATVSINGVEVGHADNMFRTWEFDVKPHLHAGSNSISIRFTSPLPYIRRRQAQRCLSDVGGPPYEPQGRGWVRKEPCNFGWDWGPVLVTCGIWRPIALLAFDQVRLTGIRIDQDHSQPGRVVLAVTPEVEPPAQQPLTARASVSLDGPVVAEAETECSTTSPVLRLTVQAPQLWWPDGLGAQPLYDLQVDLLDQAGQVLDHIDKRIGLRTLRLERQADEWGESFRFVANGVPFFAKGSDWIPADAFAPRVTEARYRQLLEAAVASHQNMLRVWGGGIYESDLFYDLCDELGICIWQDMMFACATYPTFEASFMDNVRAEAQDNIRRLRHHACLALWCGNNELEQGLVGPSWSNTQMSWDDYSRLFDRLLPQIVQELDPGCDYWPSSPHSPLGDRADWNNPACGDAHLWSVWHGREPFEWYRSTGHRFVTEFGFQSFPEPQTVNGFTAPQDRNITSYVMEHHQRSLIGNSVIMHYMLDWFRMPTSFEMTLWLSQILQGMGIQLGVEHFRRNMPRTMGALYWQLDDCWPVASWSSIDYHGRWKALHYMARRFYAPVLLSAVHRPGSGMVDLYLSNDLRNPQAGEVAWSLTNVQGDELAAGCMPASMEAVTCGRVGQLDVSAHVHDHSARDLLLWLTYTIGGRTVSENLVTFARPKHLELAEPAIAAEVEELGDGRLAVTVNARRPSLWVWLTAEGLDQPWSDSFFHLRPAQPRRVTVAVPHGWSADRLREALHVYSLLDTYRSLRNGMSNHVWRSCP